MSACILVPEPMPPALYASLPLVKWVVLRKLVMMQKSEIFQQILFWGIRKELNVLFTKENG